MEKKTVVVTGGSGFVGSILVPTLQRKGYRVVVMDIIPPKVSCDAFVPVNFLEAIPQDPALKNPYAYIHLAGKNIFGRFTAQHKNDIYTSRIVGTRHLINMIKNEPFRPQVFLSASAVGYYGDSRDVLVDESYPHGDTFLSSVVLDWEHEIARARLYDMRTVIFRQGHVLGNGGLLSALLPWYRRGLGGPLGSGKQWFPWIHIHDLVHLYAEAVANKNIAGVFNAVSHPPLRQYEFSQALARAMDKPHLLRIPKIALAVVFGKEFTQEMTVSQKIVSHNLARFEYRLQWNHIETALRSIVSMS